MPYQAPSRKRWLPLALAALAISAMLGLLTLSRFVENDVRPLSVDERESVIKGFSALENQVPEIREWVMDASDVVADDSLPSFFDPSEDSLVRFDEDMLFFSPRFFEADTVAQGNALLAVVMSLRQPTMPRLNEVAIRPAE